jgi:hypothetical protein
VCFSVVAVALAAEEAPAAVLPALGYPYAAYPYAYGHGALAPAAYTIVSAFFMVFFMRLCKSNHFSKLYECLFFFILELITNLFSLYAI